MSKNNQQIAVLDFGSQYAHLIARRFRQLGILAKLYPTDYDLSQIDNLIGIVLSGSPGSVDEDKYPFKPEIFEMKLPILAMCYGHQLIAKHFGGQVQENYSGEYGLATMQIGESVLFSGLEGGEVVWMSHSDSVVEAPPNFKIIGTTANCPIAAMSNDAKKIYSLQFHPEVTHTVHGLKVLGNFAYDICQAQKDWKIEDWLDQIIKKTKDQVNNKKVFLLVSGGVDSTVCFALLEKALGQGQVYGLLVDTGLMRKNEVEQVKGSLAQAGFKNLHIKDASFQFLSKLEGVIDPEEKRKIIGKLFLDVKDEVSNDLNLNPDEWLLAQGTIYPDTIETGGTKHADVIKTHHNRVDQIQELIRQGKIIEPIKDLYKDEVRALGKLLGLAEKLVWRQPFPGPGLGIRVLCHSGVSKINQQELETINQKLAGIKKIFLEEFVCHVLPLKSVGVQGDYRTYANPCVIHDSPASPAKRGERSTIHDKIDWEFVEKLSPEITNKVREVNRVLIKISNSQLPISNGGLIEATVTKQRLDLLREIDAMVQEEIRQAKLERDIWQFPVVLIPFGINGKESIVLRPVSSLEAMTARFYPLPQEVLDSIVKKIQALNQISFIFYDVTNKPPGTIEWE